MHRWNIFLIKELSMLASPQIKTINLLITGVVLNFSSFGRNCVTTFPGWVASKACWLTWFILRIPRILHVLVLMCWYLLGTYEAFYRNNNLSTTCQCWQLKLNPLSMQINIYCLMTNQMPVLLVQHTLWTQSSELLLLQSLYFSRPPSPTA